eukprot:CAMPEP_0117433044 /NCGR_PEP_ID=MMETSP0758-20121206/12462_1 /TAXON_ID=63605 /ORGANISM="Percolomonas cosmopolitus, Strain AE-1 (ATCC 50343)" /LENGTH=659 /DNA_ID=CAMNT_0005223427 /DNA_START=624 /DNA_END=2603 /DNA_ORIENTATION=-
MDKLLEDYKNDLVKNLEPKWQDGSREIQKKVDTLQIQLEEDDTEATKLVKEGHIFDKKTELEAFLEKWGASHYLNPPKDEELDEELKLMKRKNDLENQLLHEWQIDNWLYVFQYDKELQDKIRRQNRFAGLIFDDSLDLYHNGLKTNSKVQNQQDYLKQQQEKRAIQQQQQQQQQDDEQQQQQQQQQDGNQHQQDVYGENSNTINQVTIDETTGEVILNTNQDHQQNQEMNSQNTNGTKSPISSINRNQLETDLQKSQEELRRLRDAAKAMEAAMKERQEKLKQKYMEQLNAFMSQMENLQNRIRELELENLQYKQAQLRMAQNAENEQYMIDSLYKYRKKLEDRELEIVRLRKALQQREHLKLKRNGQLNVFDMVNVDDLFDLKLKITDTSRQDERKKRIHQKTSIKNKEFTHLKEFEQMMTARPTTIHDPLYQSIQKKASTMNAKTTRPKANVTTDLGSMAHQEAIQIKPKRRPSSALGIIHVPKAEEDKNLKKEVADFISQQMSNSLADIPLCYDSDASSEDVGPFHPPPQDSKSLLEKTIITMDTNHVPKKKKKKQPRPLSSIRRSQLSSSMSRLQKSKKKPFQQSDMLKVQSMIASQQTQERVLRPSTATLGRRLKATRLRSAHHTSSNMGDTIVYGNSKKMPRLKKRAKSSLA